MRGQRVVPLGPDHFGQSGDIPDLYREYDIDTDAILDACAQALLAVGAERSACRVHAHRDTRIAEPWTSALLLLRGVAPARAPTT